MSENNQNKGQRDSFAKPGDESIVSGKSFFLSFGKQKKSSANPLIESEKNKNNQKNAEQNKKNEASKPQNQKPQKNDGGDGKHGANSQEKNNFRGKHHDKKQNRNQNQNQNQNRDRAPEQENLRQKQEAKPQENKPRENDAADRAQNRNPHGNNRRGKGRDNDNRGNRDNRENAELREVREASEVKPQENKPRDDKNKDKGRNHQNDRRDRRNRPEQRQDMPIKQEKAAEAQAETAQTQKNDSSSRSDDRRRPKHKKEKFVPSAPEAEISANDLLQPIVDRTGIISSPGKGFGLRPGKSSFMGGGFSSASSAKDENEPRYIDRNIPLAQQIAEQSKPKTYKNHITENAETVEVIGVRFREAGKVYYFAPGSNKVKKDDAVIVETARGVEYGFCAIANRMVSTDNIVPPLKPILRIATKDDTERYEGNKQLEAGAAKIFREKVRALGLEMSLVYVEYTFDNGKLLFYFTADGRVDFRELIKELASAFRTRIELRQIGVRDEAKIVGGLGICGRPVCCKSFLGEFSQVSIKMAKDQNLFINSSKISGTCGRFMCCIRYEDEVYQKEYERTPKVDAIVETPEGKGVVVESNALKGMVKVLLDEKPDAVAMPFKCTDVKLLGYIKKDNENDVPEGIEIPEEGSGS